MALGVALKGKQQQGGRERSQGSSPRRTDALVGCKKKIGNSARLGQRWDVCGLVGNVGRGRREKEIYRFDSILGDLNIANQGPAEWKN